jgi:RES domain-containing protein
VKLYRARAWRGGPATFDALDSAPSIAGPKGWRFNDLTTEILYAAEVEALATLEVAVRPGWETIQQVLIATIEIPDGSLVNLSEFLNSIASSPTATRPIGLRVPSVLSSTDFNVLLDPSRKPEMSARISSRIPFNTLRTTGS